MNSSIRTSRPVFVRTLGALLALALVPLLGGCAVVVAGVAGAGAVAYVRGELTTDLTHNLDAVYGASQRAIAQLEFAKIEERKSGVDARLVSRTASDKRIEIELERVSNELTKVKIRVGTFGDQTLSMLILDKINAALK